jgi:predicted ATP-grasp superfamily ATP-dependent carboligase
MSLAISNPLQGETVSTVLTIVGTSARAAAQSAARSGFSVHAADMFADADLLEVADASPIDDYPVGLERILSGTQPGCWLYTGALENYSGLIAKWQTMRPLLGNSAQVLRVVRSPDWVVTALRAASLAALEVRRDCRNLAADGAWLAKPLHSAGGSYIAPFDHKWLDDCSAPQQFYFQKRISGKSLAAIYIATPATVELIGVTEQLCGFTWGGDKGFRYCGSIGPLKLEPRLSVQFQQIGLALQRAAGLVGIFGVDTIVRDHIVYPVEVNPRYTASVEVLERATGFHAIAAHVVACTHGKLRSPARARRLSGKLIVWADRNCWFPGRNVLPAELFSVDPMQVLADVPAAGTVIQAGAPIATVFAEAETTSVVAERLRMRATLLLAACPAV